MKRLLVLAVLFVAGCAPPIESGTVTDKYHREAHSTVRMQAIGKMMIPITDHHPERWSIEVSDGKHREWVRVSEDEYNRLDIGDNWER